MKETINNKLKKPDGSDFVKVQDLNGNWDSLDTMIGNLNGVTTTGKDIASAINELNQKSGGITETIAWKRLPTNADMNNYKTEGNYYSPANADVGTMKNVPFPNTAFSIIVLKNAGCTQIATTYQNTKEAIKIRNEYQGSWGAWVDVITGQHITSDLTSNGYLIPNGNAVYHFATSNFLRDMKRNLSVADLNNPNYPFPYIASTNQGKSISLTGDWYHIQYYRHQNNDGYGSQIAIPLSGSAPTVLVRNSSLTTWSSWRDVATGGLKKVHKISGNTELAHFDTVTITIPTINSVNSFVGNTTGCVYTKGSLAVEILNNTQVRLRGIFSDSYVHVVNYSFEIIEFH